MKCEYKDPPAFNPISTAVRISMSCFPKFIFVTWRSQASGISLPLCWEDVPIPRVFTSDWFCLLSVSSLKIEDVCEDHIPEKQICQINIFKKEKVSKRLLHRGFNQTDIFIVYEKQLLKILSCYELYICDCSFYVPTLYLKIEKPPCNILERVFW